MKRELTFLELGFIAGKKYATLQAFGERYPSCPEFDDPQDEIDWYIGVNDGIDFITELDEEI
jgi:hypothetical protein